MKIPQLGGPLTEVICHVRFDHICAVAADAGAVMGAALAVTFPAILPDLLLIALGAGLRRWGDGGSLWAALDRLNFTLLLPALIFTAAARRQMGTDALLLGGAGWGVILLGLALGLALRRIGPARFLDFAGIWQCCWRFNTALAFVAVASFPAAIAANIAVVIGASVPIANLFAISGLAAGRGIPARRALRDVITNPFFLASIAGLTVASGVATPPAVLGSTLDRLAAAALPLSLLSLGSALDLAGLRRPGLFVGLVHGVKLAALPLLTFTATVLLRFDPPAVIALTLFSALPTASAAHILATRYGADRRQVATIVTQSTLLGILTLPAWIAFLTAYAF